MPKRGRKAPISEKQIHIEIYFCKMTAKHSNLSTADFSPRLSSLCHPAMPPERQSSTEDKLYINRRGAATSRSLHLKANCELYLCIQGGWSHNQSEIATLLLHLGQRPRTSRVKTVFWDTRQEPRFWASRLPITSLQKCCETTRQQMNWSIRSNDLMTICNLLYSGRSVCNHYSLLSISGEHQSFRRL